MKLDCNCYDCGLSYSDDGFCDLVVNNDIWDLISPIKGQSEGLLCPNCMIRRCNNLGLKNVEAMFASGPFAPEGE